MMEVKKERMIKGSKKTTEKVRVRVVFYFSIAVASIKRRWREMKAMPSKRWATWDGGEQKRERSRRNEAQRLIVNGQPHRRIIAL